MNLLDFVHGKINCISLKDIIYYIFPIFLIAILYYTLFPFNQVYIGEWHDIFANSMYYSLLDQNYFVTWNNLWAGGFPLTASPHSDKFYIFSFPFYLIFQNLSIVNFIILLHLLIAYFAFFKLGTLITKNYNARLIFSVLFAFSGMMLGRIYAGHHLLLYGLAWIPLLYYFFFKIVLYKEATILNAVFLSIVSALVYFTGNVYHFILAYLVIAIFFIYYALDRRISRKIFYYLFLSVILTTLLISVKSIPDFGVSGAISRQDIIDPLEGGGSIETNLASFIFGIRIDNVWAQYESGIMIGIIPLLLMIIALVYGRKEITIPSFFAILFSFIWADGGKNIISFMHFLPIVNNFRCPGRILGAILPIVLFLSLYGAIILFEKIKKGEIFTLSSEQRKYVTIGVFLLIVLKLFELPHQEMISFEAAAAVILLVFFIGLLSSGKGSVRNILIYFFVGLVVNCIVLVNLYSIIQMDIIIKLIFLGALLIALFMFIWKTNTEKGYSCVFCGVLFVCIFLMLMGNLGSGYTNGFSPQLEKSPARDVIQAVKVQPLDNAQVWVYETGWPIKHMEFTYWDVMNGIHPMSLYAAYYLKEMPMLTYTIGNTTYFSADYIIDTQYLENGNQNIPDVTFKVDNISVYKPDYVLPNAFVVRNEQIIPTKIEKFSPDDVTMSGLFLSGDTAVLKTSYYPGWKVNGQDASNVGNMVAIRVPSDTSSITFKFDPLDVKIGAVLSGLGIILIIVLIFKRKEIEKYLSGTEKKQEQDPVRKKKKR